MDAGTNDYKTSVFNISFFKSSTEELIKKMQESTYYLSNVVIDISNNQIIFWDYLKIAKNCEIMHQILILWTCIRFINHFMICRIL